MSLSPDIKKWQSTKVTNPLNGDINKINFIQWGPAHDNLLEIYADFGGRQSSAYVTEEDLRNIRDNLTKFLER